MFRHHVSLTPFKGNESIPRCWLFSKLLFCMNQHVKWNCKMLMLKRHIKHFIRLSIWPEVRTADIKCSFPHQKSPLFNPMGELAHSLSMMKRLYDRNPVTFLKCEQAWKNCVAFIRCIPSDGHTVGSEKKTVLWISATVPHALMKYHCVSWPQMSTLASHHTTVTSHIHVMQTPVKGSTEILQNTERCQVVCVISFTLLPESRFD